jgi:hypothetical protein
LPPCAPPGAINQNDAFFRPRRPRDARTGYFAPRAGSFYGPPPTFGGTLGQVYLCWFLGVVILYFPCRWYAGVKARRKDLVRLRYL